MLTTLISPYLLYIKVVAGVLLVAGVLSGWWWFNHVLNERDELKQKNQVMAVQLQEAAKMVEFSNKVTEAIGQIKIRSTINVQKIESEPPPEVTPSQPIVFIPFGMHMQTMYSSSSASRTKSRHEGSSAIPPR